MTKEKRRRTRAPLNFDVDILLGEKVVRAEIINISLNGLLCTSDPLFQMNAPCNVVVSLSEDSKISIAAKISRVGEKESAIRFEQMNDESFRHLKKLVQYNVGDADRIDKELQKKAFD